jgi:RHS repeat-associated protein
VVSLAAVTFLGVQVLPLRYDHAGNRAYRSVVHSGVVVEERWYLGDVELYRRRSAQGAVLQERRTLHLMDGERRLALVDTVTADRARPAAVGRPALRYQHGNLLGSSCLELDGQGAVISYEEYYPFGATSYQAGRGVAETSLKRYRYAGRERDEETGLCYHGARYLAPWLARWTSPDPAGLADGPNAYVAMRNNPVRLVDPDGRQSTPPPGPDEPRVRPLGPGSADALLRLHRNLGQQYARAPGVRITIQAYEPLQHATEPLFLLAKAGVAVGAQVIHPAIGLILPPLEKFEELVEKEKQEIRQARREVAAEREIEELTPLIAGIVKVPKGKQFLAEVEAFYRRTVREYSKHGHTPQRVGQLAEQSTFRKIPEIIDRLGLRPGTIQYGNVPVGILGPKHTQQLTAEIVSRYYRSIGVVDLKKSPGASVGPRARGQFQGQSLAAQESINFPPGSTAKQIYGQKAPPQFGQFKIRAR